MIHLRLAIGFSALAAFTLLALPLQVVFMKIWTPGARRLAMWWHRLALRIIGVRVYIHGKIPSACPVLIVANHLSWADIVVLGSIMELCFVAKAEVRDWPGINLLAWLQRTVFIDRARRRESGRQADSIATRLLEGDAMVLFAEGTTGNGHRILPFKSALFGAVHAALDASDLSHVTVQPVAIAYTRLHGLPLGRLHQSRAAWPGDVALAPHLAAFLRAGAYDVHVTFCPARDFSSETRRRDIARHCHDDIRAAFVASMRAGEGRTPAEPRDLNS